jgi:hypothetical protein
LAKEKVNNMLIEPDWLNVLVEWGEKVTSFKLTKYDFAAAYLDTSALLCLLTRMQTCITVVDKNGIPFGGLEGYCTCLCRAGKRI